MGAWERCGLSTAPDATDWKAKCEAMEDAYVHESLRSMTQITALQAELTAAQAENEKLRAAIVRWHECPNTDSYAALEVIALAALTTTPSKTETRDDG